MFYDKTIAVVGSVPLSKFTNIGRTPKDLDIICTREAFAGFISSLSRKHEVIWVRPTEGGGAALIEMWNGEGIIIDAEFMGEGNTSSLPLFEEIIARNPPLTLSGYELHEADLDTLYLLKMSHRYLRAAPDLLIEKFDKTRKDILLMRKLGAKICNEELYQLRVAETYKYKHPALNVSKEEFFKDDNIKCIYDHDTLHEAVAIGEAPAYTKYLKDGSPVECDRAKFEALPLEDRLLGVYEEACVLALERAVIPYQADPEWAFQIALRKVCTSITSGWFREFGWEHFDEVLAIHEQGIDYVDKFNKALAAGRILPFKESVY